MRAVHPSSSPSTVASAGTVWSRDFSLSVWPFVAAARRNEEGERKEACVAGGLDIMFAHLHSPKINS